MQGAEASQTSDSYSSEESAHSHVYHCKCQTMAEKSRSSEAHVEVFEHCHQNMMHLVQAYLASCMQQGAKIIPVAAGFTHILVLRGHLV